MDKIAVISDVHGNIVALDTVLADIRQRGIDLIYNLGDLSGKGAHGAEVVDRCRDVCAVTVRGNWDVWAVGDDPAPDIRWWLNQLGDDRLAYLRGLPNSYDFTMSGKALRLYHASHISEHHRMYPFETHDYYVPMFTNTDFTGHDAPAPDVVGYGDIHMAMTLTLPSGHQTLFNPGSVGNPLDIPATSYAILSGVLDSPDPAPFSIETVRLPYDIEQAIDRARDTDMPGVDVLAQELRTAVYRHSSRRRADR
jgi:predicted phosphodiesterase